MLKLLLRTLSSKQMVSLISVSFLIFIGSCAEFGMSKKKGATPVNPAVTPGNEITPPPSPVPEVPVGISLSYLPASPVTGEQVVVTVTGCDPDSKVTWSTEQTTFEQTTFDLKVNFNTASVYPVTAECLVAGVTTQATIDITVAQGTNSSPCGQSTGCCCCCCNCCGSSYHFNWKFWKSRSGCQ